MVTNKLLPEKFQDLQQLYTVGVNRFGHRCLRDSSVERKNWDWAFCPRTQLNVEWTWLNQTRQNIDPTLNALAKSPRHFLFSYINVWNCNFSFTNCSLQHLRLEWIFPFFIGGKRNFVASMVIFDFKPFLVILNLLHLNWSLLLAFGSRNLYVID